MSQKRQLYKVLTKRQTSILGKRGFKWTLNRWKVHRGPLVCCSSGLHATYRPAIWFNGNHGLSQGHRVFRFEVAKDARVYRPRYSNKIITNKGRITVEVKRDSKEWLALGLPTLKVIL